MKPLVSHLDVLGNEEERLHRDFNVFLNIVGIFTTDLRVTHNLAAPMYHVFAPLISLHCEFHEVHVLLQLQLALPGWGVVHRNSILFNNLSGRYVLVMRLRAFTFLSLESKHVLACLRC